MSNSDTDNPLEELKRIWGEVTDVGKRAEDTIRRVEKISALRTEEFFRERRARANVKKARKILKRAGKEALREGDEVF